MGRSWILSVLASVMCVTACVAAHGQTRILYLSKSSGFEHAAVKRTDDQPSVSEKILTQLAEEHGAEITCTKDASLINAENLRKYDVVIFYTTGVLTETGTDGQPAMGPDGLKDLIAWVNHGGGFVGLHAATDTFGTPKDQEPNDYTKLIGGTFDLHGDQFDGPVRIVDPTHPAVEGLPVEWTIHEEWYRFNHLDKENLHVLAILDTTTERAKQEKYNVPSYPIIWCKTVGKGRVYYNGLGHNKSVWNDPTFQTSVVNGVRWALGEGPAQAEPNYKEVVPDHP